MHPLHNSAFDTAWLTRRGTAALVAQANSIWR
jgi:hypothetical protein